MVLAAFSSWCWLSGEDAETATTAKVDRVVRAKKSFMLMVLVMMILVLMIQYETCCCLLVDRDERSEQNIMRERKTKLVANCNFSVRLRTTEG